MSIQETATLSSAGEYLEELNGVKLRFRVSGSGPVCILQTPGWGPEIAAYRELAGFEDTFTMVYLDTRGSGGSERPDDSTFTFENFAADVDGVRRFLGADQVVAMGHSFAGVLCIEYTLRYPRSVAGLILLDAVVAEVPEAQRDRQQRIDKMRGEPWLPDAIDALETIMGGYVPTSDEEFASFVGRFLPPYFVDQSICARFQEGLAAAVWSHDAYRGSLNLEMFELDLRPRLREIDAPALVVVGSADFICGPIQSQWAHENLRNSVLMEVQGVGHFPWLEAPHEFFSRAKKELRDLGIRA
jgi:proline iminopeptidase